MQHTKITREIAIQEYPYPLLLFTADDYVLAPCCICCCCPCRCRLLSRFSSTFWRCHVPPGDLRVRISPHLHHPLSPVPGPQLLVPAWPPPCPSLATILAVACRRNKHLIIGDAATSHHALPRERRHIFSIEKTGNETMNRHRQYKSWGELKAASRHYGDLTTITAVIGAPFLPFQWDILLLEVGGLAVLASPILPLMSGDEWECPIAVVAALRCLISP